MVRWTIVLESRADGAGDGSDVIAVRKLLKAALRWHGLRWVEYDRVRVYRDDAERREAVADWVKEELARRNNVTERRIEQIAAEQRAIYIRRIEPELFPR